MKPFSFLTLPLLMCTLLMSACATVSVVVDNSPEIEAQSDVQSDIQIAGETFEQKALSRGWILPSPNLSNMTNILIDGKSQTNTPGKDTYAYFIGAEIRPMAEIKQTIVTDVKDATSSLQTVSDKITAFLAIEMQARTITERTDLINYERCLVKAHQTKRNFTRAIELAKLKEDGDIQLVETGFIAEIDRAQRLIKALHADYSGHSTSENTS